MDLFSLEATQNIDDMFAQQSSFEMDVYQEPCNQGKP